MKNLPKIIEFNNLHITANLKLAKNTLKDFCGIYCIKCLETGAMYIGSSVDIGDRLIDHIIYNSGNNSNIHLQNSIDKYGLSCFIFSVVEFCTPSDLLQREQHYLDWLFSLASNLRYNFCPTAGSALGYRHTEKTRANISDAKSGVNNPFFGKAHTEETRAEISSSRKGRIVSEETRAKIRGTLKGRVLSDITRQRISESQRKVDRRGKNSYMFGIVSHNAHAVYLYNVEGILIDTFTSQVAAGQFLGISETTVRNYIKSNKLFNGLYTITNSPKSL